MSPGFFRMLGVRVLHGREFAPADAPRVVNQAFVSAFRMVGNGVGRPLQLHGGSGLAGEWYTIIGVVGEVRAQGLGSGADAVPRVYFSAWQHPPRAVGLMVRDPGDPLALVADVESAVRAAAAEAEISAAMTLEAYLARTRAPLRWFALVYGALAAAALLLAIGGLHALMSSNVARRTREIGIRMAMGARVRDISRLVLGQSLRIVGAGAVVGLIAASAVMRLLQLLLEGVEPFDPVAFGAVSTLLGSVALVASHRPSRQAASVDPQVSLRVE